MITIIDYDMGNLKSIANALNHLEIGCEITGEVEKIKKAEKIILPGVGAFRDAIGILKDRGIDSIIKKKAKDGTPILGICLGMQLLFDRSYEGEPLEGLGLISGEIIKLEEKLEDKKRVKIPHIGWNNLIIKNNNELLKNVNDNEFVYFVHSYYGKVKNNENLIAEAVYGNNKISAVVGNKNVQGTQFHPEKSGAIGLQILKNFGEMS